MINPRKSIGRLYTIAALAAFCLPAGCSKKDAPVATRAEQPVTATPPLPRVESEPAKLPPATISDVQAAIKRVFGDDVRLSADFVPAFVTGDLNGDGDEDLAVIVRPVPGKLDDVNNELANWSLFDADKFFVAPPNKSVVVPPKLERPRIEEEDLLAVIHGVGANGWRNSEARQAYLVKHGAANYSGKAVSISEKKIRAMRLPLKTDILRGQRNHKRGFLFWTGSAYAWQDAG
ncbi:MAG: FG-GAP repeat protein [Acidobacteriia bacterium]|nr:FG-GAP repeat protein [Terriglobia bacterium]